MGKVSFTLSSFYGRNSSCSILENSYRCYETTTNIFLFRSWLTLFLVSVLVCSSRGLPERCDMRPDTGDCKEFVHKWFFNNNTLQCDTFIYGSCGGNDNRFDSEVACMTACVKGYEPPQYFGPVTNKVSPTTTTVAPVTKSVDTKQEVTLPPVPLQNRGDELTFEESGHHKVFMFAKKNTFIQLDGNRIPNFQLRICREISFQFRTKLPHGLLVYHSVKDRPDDLEPYALYIIVEKGELKVVHVFGEESTSVTVGEGLNNDQWHSVAVRIDVHGTRLIAKVDKDNVETQIKGLNKSTNYGVSTDLTPVVLIGGLSSEEKLHGVKYITESFIGCIKDMILSAGKAASELIPIKPLLATKHENVVEGCVNKCHTRENLCFFGSKCINHYNEYTCDCFGTRYESELCDIYTATILTLRGSSYVSYRVYDWKDRSHSSANRISLQFKTLYDDSALFYASGEPDLHYIAVSLKNLSVYIEINLGGGSIMTTIGDHLATNYWNNLTIAHYNNRVRIHLNNEAKEFDLPETFYNLYIDPEIYIGGGPELTKKKGLVSHNNFVGSLKYVFFNDISIIYELKKGNPKVHYIGVLDPEFYETDVDAIPITLPFPSSHLRLPVNNTESLSLQFDFRSNKSIAILAASNVTTASGRGYWEVRLVNEEIRFELVPNQLNNVTHLTTVKFSSHSTWHSVDLKYKDGSLDLTVDYRHKSSQLFVQQFKLDNTVLIGNGNKNNQGLVGCIRDITVNGERFEARYLTSSNYSVGEISLDNCQLIDPCKRPNACEHGGRCSIKDDHILCDCEGTGYIGKNCHFAIHRKTCEELALLGYTKPSVYWIDIDGNGRFPPAHVKCDFQTPEDSTKTIVEHNLPSQMDVRSFGETDFSVKIKYREFSPEMLQELISHSLHCSQYIKYDCYKAPLELHSATWFKSSANKDIVDYIGEVKKGTCTCAVNKTCIEKKQSCNCDVSDPMWHSDEAFYNFPNSLGITEMVFLQQKELENDSQGRITLGPLECVETNTQKYVVTFTSSQSYIEVPGWRKGDISFSFRTTGEKAILLFQPPIRPHHPSFMVALTSDFTLTFNFTLNTGRSRELEIKSGRRLNGGEWQKIWIDYNEHHVRFMINTENQMVDLLPEEEFGPFEGSMFIGGATEELLKASSVRQGLIGCFRGLVVNGEILDIYSYMSVHLSEIIKDCKPSCDPNPCKNGATCKELWSTHQCVCENPWAHIGPLCDKNINVNGLTFITEESYYLPSSNIEVFQQILTESFLINLRTYVQSAFILYANDHLNNFVQLYIEDGNYVVFAFNSDNEIYNIKIEYPGLNKGKSVQVAVIRSQENITLYVNNKNQTIAANMSLLSEYNNKPWLNQEKEILAPPRPRVAPREYFQIVIGGYNTEHLVATSINSSLPGYIGCIRGLKIGDEVINLQVEGFVESVKSAFNEFVDMAGDEVLKYSGFKTINGGFTIGKEEKGIKDGCKMKCDEIPCKNQGVCIEDFEKSENTCNCEHTSYFGDTCAEEKGSDFEGESAIRRKYLLDAPVSDVKVQLAFSSSIPHKTNTVLLLLQTEHKRNYNLLVSINSNGHLTFREDREGSSLIANVEDRNFINGARHSVYYQRNIDNTTFLLIDRDEISLEPTSVLSLSELPEGEQGSNEVQVGGLNTTDPRFTAYKSFTGCMSNVLVEVNSNIMKPLEEYMLWVKEGTNEVNVVNPQGIRVGQCANFDERKLRPTPSSNHTDENDPQPYSEDPPTKEPYKSLYTERSPQESSSSTIIFLVLFVLFVIIVLGSLCEVYRTHRKYKKRKEEEAEASILWPKSQQYQDPIGNSTIKMTGYKNVPLQDMKTKPQDSKPIIKNDYQPVLVADEKPLNINGERKGNIDNTDKELAWEPNVDNIGLLPDKSLEDLSQRFPNTVVLNNKNTDDYPIKPGQGQIPEGNINGVSNLVHSNSSPHFPTIPEEGLDIRDPLTPDTDPVASKPQSFITGTTLPPIFFNEGFRTFGNPISYLGGPRLQTPSTARTSKESVLSLD